jgi:Leucine-rich repeat (LRR) protein
LNPCTCDENNNIHCGGSNSIELKTIFHQMSTKLENGKKHFNGFSLNNTLIKELTENTFEDITFDEVWIYNMTNLSLIHTNAFEGMSSSLKEFSVSNTSLKNSPPNYDIFSAISSMVNITYAQISNSLIEEIPENAFKPLNGTQKNLSILNLNDNKITKIGNNAFEYLDSLTQLELDGNKLNHISENAFNFSKSSDKLLQLFLDRNSLNSSSFEKGAFDKFNRPTYIIFSFGHNLNNITYLDQHIFEEFMNNNNHSKIDSITIDCKDCRSFWLFQNEKYSKQLSFLKCSNSKAFSDENNFPECKHF